MKESVFRSANVKITIFTRTIMSAQLLILALLKFYMYQWIFFPVFFFFYFLPTLSLFLMSSRSQCDYESEINTCSLRLGA